MRDLLSICFDLIGMDRTAVNSPDLKWIGLLCIRLISKWTEVMSSEFGTLHDSQGQILALA